MRRNIRIGLGNVDPTVGAFESNTNKLIAQAKTMARLGCTVGSFPEGSLPGYPAEDLVQWRWFVDMQWLQLWRFSQQTSELPTVFTLGLTVQADGHLYNSVAVVHRGKIVGIVPKMYLAEGGVFYDTRTFTAGTPGLATSLNDKPFGDLLFRFPFGTMGVQVCEDVWSSESPIHHQANLGAELIINHSASPFRAGIVATREELLATRSAESQSTLVYVNQVGGNDGLVFDGGGYIYQNGRLLFRAERWNEGVSTHVIDLDETRRQRFESNTWRRDSRRYRQQHEPAQLITVPDGPGSSDILAIPSAPLVFLPAVQTPQTSTQAYHDERLVLRTDVLEPRARHFEDLLAAMEWSLKGYVEKTGAFERIGISLSGGKDSALTLIAAWRYARNRFGDDADAIRDFIHCFSFPTAHNSEDTKSIARELCRIMDVTFTEVPIGHLVAADEATVRTMLGGGEPTGNTRQNIQARIRAKLMWDWSNSSKALFLQPGNMSEKAVGYTTIGGDLMGAYSLIGNLPKTVVIELLKYLHEVYGWGVLERLNGTVASAELADGQADETDLMPFPVLDACFYHFAGQKMGAVDLYRTLRATWTDDQLAAISPGYRPGMLRDWVKRFLILFFRSIYKWVQSPPTTHLGSLDLDRERAFQIPVVQSLEWLHLEQLDHVEL